MDEEPQWRFEPHLGLTLFLILYFVVKIIDDFFF